MSLGNLCYTTVSLFVHLYYKYDKNKRYQMLSGWQVSGVVLTFEKLRIANAQHGKNCVSSPAAKATISTDLPKIDKHENTNV